MMPKFSEFYNYPLRKINGVIRYSGEVLTRPETVGNHTIDLGVLALKVYQALPKYVDKKDLIYRIFIHDMEESTSCDVPRTLKHYDATILKEIDRVGKALYRPFVSEEIFNDTFTAKDLNVREGRILKFLDVFQCCCVLHQEIYFLGNKTLQPIYTEATNLLSKIVLEDKIFKNDPIEVKVYFEDLMWDFLQNKDIIEY